MNEKKIIEIMKERGYTLSYKVADGKGELKFMEFLFIPSEEHKKERFPVPPYCCTIDVKENTFSFTYVVPGSVNKLKMEEASPFENEEHFTRLATKFESQAAVLNKYCAV